MTSGWKCVGNGAQPGLKRLKAQSDPRDVVTDAQASYFGIKPSERTLLPGDDARLGTIRLEDWLGQVAAAAPR